MLWNRFEIWALNRRLFNQIFSICLNISSVQYCQLDPRLFFFCVIIRYRCNYRCFGVQFGCCLHSCIMTSEAVVTTGSVCMNGDIGHWSPVTFLAVPFRVRVNILHLWPQNFHILLQTLITWWMLSESFIYSDLHMPVGWWREWMTFLLLVSIRIKHTVISKESQVCCETGSTSTLFLFRVKCDAHVSGRASPFIQPASQTDLNHNK